MSKKRKKRYKKSHDIKVLKARWKLERFDPKRRDDIMKTIIAIIWLIIFTFTSVLTIFVWGIYEPIDKEDAVSRSVEFDRFDVYYSRRHNNKYIVLTNGEKIFLPGVYFVGDTSYYLYDDLRSIEHGTPLELKLHPDGTVLEISTELVGHKEILNFDYSQKKLFEQSVFFFVLGILSGLGAIALIFYAWKMIVKRKVFVPSKNIYKR